MISGRGVATRAEALADELATCQQADAIRDHAAALDRAVERFGPAADAVASMATRLDKLCAWLSGKWPWLMFIGFALINRTINSAPSDVPRLLDAATRFLTALAGAK